MPVIQIQTLETPDTIDKGTVLKGVITKLSAAIDTPENRIFASWQTSDCMVDQMTASTSFRADTHPPLVRIDMFTGRTPEKKKKALQEIAAYIKEQLDFAGNPFVYIYDIQNGHVMTGGNVIEV